MLSILISTYNHSCYRLVKSLQLQAERLVAGGDFIYEIIVSDDSSTDESTILINQRINTLPHCTFIQQPQNRGQAINRNWLRTNSRHPYVLFIDADAQVLSEDFLKNYWANRHVAPVVCGSLCNLQTPCPKGCELRYKYEEAAAKIRTLEFRRAHSSYFLTAFNLFFNREVFKQITFDERCKSYGYEDALLGLELAERGIQIHHITNPLIHTGIDTNAVFLQKTRTALHTLYQLGEPLHSFAGPSRWRKKLAEKRLLCFFRWTFKLFRPLCEKQLLSRHPSLFLFKLYKLGYYANIK